jgi:hypothetical protein
MQPGDYFIVDQLLRSGEEIRHYTTVRAAQLGILLSVTVNDEEHPGFTRVTRRSHEEVEKPDCVRLKDWGEARARLNSWYGVNGDELPMFEVYRKGKFFFEAEQIKEPPIKRAVFNAGEKHRDVGMIFEKHGFTGVCLPLHTTPEAWPDEIPTIDEVMK